MRTQNKDRQKTEMMKKKKGEKNLTQQGQGKFKRTGEVLD